MIESFKLPTITEQTVQGSVCSFNSEYELPLFECKSAISGYQEGTGTPSPSNIRNIVSFSSGILTVDNDTYTFTFGKNIYSGEIDWLNGKVTANYVVIDLGDLEWKYTSATTRFYTDDITDISLEANFTNMLCSIYDVILSSSSFANMPDKSIKRSVSGAQISIRDLDYTDVNLFTTAVTGQKLAYELAQPLVIPLGGIHLLAKEGQNTISCSTSDTSVKFGKVN